MAKHVRAGVTEIGLDPDIYLSGNNCMEHCYGRIPSVRFQCTFSERFEQRTDTVVTWYWCFNGQTAMGTDMGW